MQKIALKKREEISLMREVGLIVRHAHQVASQMMLPGITTAEIDRAIDRNIRVMGGQALFQGTPGAYPFPASSCISVNEAVVHGIPNERVLKEGDIVSVDIGVRFRGWCADAAVTHPIGTITPAAAKLLKVTEEALRRCIKSLRPGQRWKKHAAEMDRYVRENGYHSVVTMGGHGIGKALWEPPHVMHAVTADLEDFTLVEGLVIAIEPMVNMGTHKVVTAPDQWTVVTADRSLSAHFEHTIAITDRGVEVLTASEAGTGWAL